MSSSKGKYWIGIDLGTTHTVVAFRQKRVEKAQTELLMIPQWIGLNEIASLPQLPSFRYHPSEDEFPSEQLILPWTQVEVPGDNNKPKIIGEWARELSGQIEGKTVVSAKSWLSHRQADRTADILPWGAEDAVYKVSPIVASASYLAYIHSVWNHQFPDHPFVDQEIVITIPASFDEMARTLTLEAANLAGLGESEVLLLEEPQAVCYDWIRRHTEAGDLTDIDAELLLVCDVGGGTTDLSLIGLSHDRESKGAGVDIAFERIGVGDHLMLGGDNIDLALAHIAEKRLLQQGGSAKQRFTATTLSQLLYQTRRAKEALLGRLAPNEELQNGVSSTNTFKGELNEGSYPVTVLGRGTGLVGGKKVTELTVADVEAQVLGGFFARCSHDDAPQSRRSGVVEFGLPYASDACITKHVAHFLHQHQQVCREAKRAVDAGVDFVGPDAVIFNGGVFKSRVLAERLVDQLGEWNGTSLTEFDNPHPDLAVAYGAVAFLIARAGGLRKIGGGSARTFLLGIDQRGGPNKEETSTTDLGSQQAICLLPRGTEVSERIYLQTHRFALRIGTPVAFNLFSTSSDRHWEAGALVDLSEIDGELLVPLPPLVSSLESKGGQQHQANVEVSLSVVLNEIGTIALECHSIDDEECRWRLEFEIGNRPTSPQNTHSSSALPQGFSKAATAIQEVFGKSNKKSDPKSVKLLRGNMERWLEKREQWSFQLSRALADELLQGAKRRRRSEQHERLWFNLVGFCLRPGMGDQLDQWRLEQVWPLFKTGLQFDQTSQAWSEWWTFWRRLSGGLTADQQEAVFREIAKYINPVTARNRKVAAELKGRSYEDMVRLVGSLEHLSVEVKTEVAGWLLRRLEKPSASDVCWWALGRLGARVPFYGSVHRVVPTEKMSEWVERVLQADWKSSPMLPLSATLLARKSGDRSRDIDADLADRVAEKLTAAKCPPHWIEMVTNGMEVESGEEKRLYGDTLPSGLKLIAINGA